MRKKLIVLSTLVVLLWASSAAALGISIINASDTEAIDLWISNLGGNVTVLEDFEKTDIGWYQSLSTGVGTCTAGGSSGTGATSYNANHVVDSNDPFFTIRNDDWYGRANTIGGGSVYLDSGDITRITLDVSPSVTNLFFYLQDPSDVQARTTVAYLEYSSAWLPGQSNGSLWFVGISADTVIDAVTWTASNPNDGYGLDQFSTVAPVPEPATMLLLGSGLVGMAAVSRRKLKQS